MIKIPKKQLFSSRILPAILLCLIPCGFVVFAASVRPSFFILLAISLAFIIGFLVFFRGRLVAACAQCEVRRQDFLEQANLLESEIEKERQAVRSLQKKIVDYGRLKDLAEELNKSFSLEETSRVLSGQASRLFGQKDITVILYLFHSKTGELGISASKKGQMEINLKAKKGDLYDHWVVKNLLPLMIEDTKKDFRFDFDKVQTEDSRLVRSLMSVPMMIGNKAIGILRLDSPVPNYFHPENIRLLTTVSDLGAIAIENAQLHEKIEDLAIRDGLTGLFLRRHFLERLEHEMSRERRQNKPLSFLMIDLDYFKRYNDMHGHMAGDIVLKTVSLMLTECFHQPGNMVCRYGGEEFAVFLPEASAKQAYDLAQTLRKQVEEQTIVLRRARTNITISIGIATFPDNALVRDELIEKADMALYEAKHRGRNCVVLTQ